MKDKNLTDFHTLFPRHSLWLLFRKNLRN